MLPHTTQNSNTTPTPLLIKVLFVGDRKVGKSSIIRQCLTDEFYPTYNPSRDLNVHMGKFQYTHYHVILQFTDCPGTVSSKEVLSPLLSNTEILAFVHWIQLCQSSVTNLPHQLLLIGNKLDLCLNGTNKVGTGEVHEILKMLPNCDYLETSSIEGRFTQKVINTIIQLSLFRRPLDVTTPTEAPPKPLYPPKKVNKDWVDSSSDGDLPPPFTMDLSEQEKNDLNEEAYGINGKTPNEWYIKSSARKRRENITKRDQKRGNVRRNRHFSSPSNTSDSIPSSRSFSSSPSRSRSFSRHRSKSRDAPRRKHGHHRSRDRRSPGSFETSKRRILPPSDSVKRVAALLAGEKTATTNWLTGMSKEGVVRPSQHRSSRNSSVQTQSLSKSESPVQQSLSRSAQSTSDPPISSPAAIHIQPQSSAATLTRLQVSTPTPSPKPAITPKQTPTKASPVKGMSWMKGKNPSKSNPHQPSVQIREMHEQVLREREQKVREKERKIELREADVLAKEEVVNNEMMVCIRLKERIERKEQEEEKKAIKTVDEEEYRKVRTLLDTVVQEKDRLKAEVATLQAEKIEWMKERAFLKGQMEIGAHRPRGQPKQAETTQEQQLLKLLEVTRHELEHERKERQRDVERIRMETQMTYARELNLLIDSTQEIANKRKESIQQSMRPP